MAPATALAAPLTVSHFYDPGQSREPEPVDAARLSAQLWERLPYPSLSLLPKPLLPGEDAGKLMQAVVKEQQALLLVTFARHKHWLERLAGRSYTGKRSTAARSRCLL